MLGLSGLIVTFVLVLIAAFPVGLFKSTVERRLSRQIGQPVTIGSLERESLFSFAPIIVARDIHASQPAWAGNEPLAAVRVLRVRLPVLPLMIGRVRPEVVTASGVRLNLRRSADKQESWRGQSDKPDQGGDGQSPLAHLETADAVIDYRDAAQRRSFTLTIHVDRAAGFVANGPGSVDGHPVSLRMRGGRLNMTDAWPFEAAIEGRALAMRARGTMATPFDVNRMTFRMSARADDLKLIDRVIEAGLFGTQPVDLEGDVQRRQGDWRIAPLTGRIGRSDLAGRVMVRTRDGRTLLDGAIRFQQLDFDDLANDAGQAAARALEQAEGLKLVPNTRVNLAKIGKTDGRIEVRADRLLSGRRPSSLTSLQGRLTLDGKTLVADQLRLGLRKGAITGQITVDQRGDRPVPTVTLALDLVDSSVGALAGGSDSGIEARLDGRIRLTGPGNTIREAVGASDGSIGVVARSGSLPAPLASLIGFDIGRGLIFKEDGRASLRCAVGQLTLTKGVGRVRTLLIDTSVSQTTGAGTLRFPEEALALSLTGAPKRDSLLRLPGTVSVSGTLRKPDILIPKDTKSVGNVLKALGRAIAGKQGETATDADCTALAGQALAAQ